MPTLNKGDRVRVVVEGEVYEPGDEFFWIGPRDDNGDDVWLCARKVTSVEVIKPKVEYKIGDIVRNLSSSHLYLITKDGKFFDLNNRQHLDSVNALAHLAKYGKHHELVYREPS